jgi:chitinase
MRKMLPLLGVLLPLGMLIASAPEAAAVTITQPSSTGDVTGCVDVAGADTAEGTRVGAYPCNNYFNEQWIWSYSQFLGIGTTSSVNTCLSVHGNATTSGSLVELDACVAKNASQEWEIYGTGALSEIIGIASKLCLDSQGNIGSGSQLVIKTCNASAGQQWELK